MIRFPLPTALAAILLIGCSPTESDNSPGAADGDTGAAAAPSPYLFVWAGAEGEGESDFLATIDADPESAESAYRLGRIVGADVPSAGLRWFRRAASIRPREPRYVFAVAVALRGAGDHDEAIAILNEMIEDHPAFADAWFALAEAYEERGQPETARGVYVEGSENENLPDDVRRRLAARVRRP